MAEVHSSSSSERIRETTIHMPASQEMIRSELFSSGDLNAIVDGVSGPEGAQTSSDAIVEGSPSSKPNVSSSTEKGTTNEQTVTDAGGNPNAAKSGAFTGRGLPNLDFPPYAEKLQNADIWKTYVKVAKEYDSDIFTGWNDGINIFLIFTGLFSAILSAFLIYSWTLLQADTGQATVDALVAISQQLARVSIGQAPDPYLVYQPEPFQIPLSALVVNALWFTGLFLSLMAAVLAMLIKEWMNAYVKHDSTRTAFEVAEERLLRYEGLETWGVQAIITFLPLAIHIALFLFFTGLVILAWPVSTALAIWMASMLGTGFCMYTASAMAPLFSDGCPYKSPLCNVLSAQRVWVEPVSSKLSEHASRMQAYVRRLYSDFVTCLRTNEADVESGANGIAVPAPPTNANDITTRDSSLPLHVKAVIWLVGSPNQIVQDDALLFLSYWRMPASGWNLIHTEVEEQSQLRLRQGRLSNARNGFPEGHLERLSLLAPLTSSMSLEYESLVPLLTGSDFYNLTTYFRRRKAGIPDLPLSLLDIHDSTRPGSTRPGEFELCVALEYILPSAVGDAMDVERAIEALNFMAIHMARNPDYRRFQTKYMDLLERTLQMENENTDIIFDSMGWESRYPGIENYIGDHLLGGIEHLLPGTSLPKEWDGKQEQVDGIRSSLVVLLVHSLDSVIGDLDFGHFERVVEWTRTLPSARVLREENRAIRRLLLTLITALHPIELLHFDRDKLEYCFEYLGRNQDGSSWLQDLFDGWIAGLNLDAAEGFIARQVIGAEGMTWLIGRIQTAASPLCAFAVIIAYAAINGLHLDSETYAIMRPCREIERKAALENLVSSQWLECMTLYGIDYVWQYVKETREGRYEKNGEKLRTMLEDCLTRLHNGWPTVDRVSALWDLYCNRFAIECRGDDHTSRFDVSTGQDDGKSV